MRPQVRPRGWILLGFSLGGHVTLRAAKRQSANAVRAAVSFFAPINQLRFGGIGAARFRVDAQDVALVGNVQQRARRDGIAGIDGIPGN